jgi:hypothetical protein
MAIINATTASQADVQAAIDGATDGDTILVPAAASGSAIWGASGSYLNIWRAVTVQGAGRGVTNIETSPSAAAYSNGTIRFHNAATFKGFTVSTLTGPATPFSSGNGINGWRLTDCDVTNNSGAYLFYPTTYGLADHCNFYGGYGSMEGFFMRGPTDAWQTPSTIGTADMVYVEDCTFNGQGYCSDGNSNAKMCFRNNVITGQMKIDGHGVSSNSPPRSCRHMEAYRNQWTNTGGGGWTAIEMRGGSGMVWGNTNLKSDYSPAFFLTEYGMFQSLGNFGNVYQTPTYYPVKDQIGVGMDPKVGGSEAYYCWNNRRLVGGSTFWTLNLKSIPQGAIDQYRAETGNPVATFSSEDIVRADRDYFMEPASMVFNGSTGVGIGTRAQMDAIVPTTMGVGFWVTDEGSWDSTLPANTSGRLYRWNGSAWNLHYTPYAYPHPLTLTPGVPTISAQPVNTTKLLTQTAVFSVGVSANPSATLQWRKNGVNIGGATSTTLTLTNTQASDAGAYDCVATNTEGSVTTNAVTLTLNNIAPGLARQDPLSSRGVVAVGVGAY